MLVKDDGAGFDAEQQRPGQFGLGNRRWRAIEPETAQEFNST